MAVPIADVLGFHGGLAQMVKTAVHRGGKGNGGYNSNGDDPDNGDYGKVDRGRGSEHNH